MGVGVEAHKGLPKPSRELANGELDTLVFELELVALDVGPVHKGAYLRLEVLYRDGGPTDQVVSVPVGDISHSNGQVLPGDGAVRYD